MSLLSPSPAIEHSFESLKRKSLVRHDYPAKKLSSTYLQSVVKESPAPFLSPPDQSYLNLQRAYKGPFQDDDECSDGSEIIDQTLNLATDMGPQSGHWRRGANDITIRSSKGANFSVRSSGRQSGPSYERLIAARSNHIAGKAKTSFYGVEIHDLLDQASKACAKNTRTPNCLTKASANAGDSKPAPVQKTSKRSNMLWTEKYRARKFTDLVGDDRLHREVLRWLKAWDPIVFHGFKPSRPAPGMRSDDDPKPHRKILLLAGPPGFGKTTLAHVCAKQAGYETLEINASDDRSSQIVRGRIKDCLGTENVRSDARLTDIKASRASKPVCVVVDEVDGVTTGSSIGGEGGFIKALMDLILLDQKNSNVLAPTSGNASRAKRKGDSFRMLRPLILICNDIYHPSLRPLRTSNLAEVLYMRKPPLDKVVSRLHYILKREGVACDDAGVQKLCEATWGVTSKKEGGSQASGDGDLRGCLVVGEWAASKLRASSRSPTGLTKAWVEDNLAESLTRGRNSRGLGRGGTKEAVERVFLDNAGFPKVVGTPLQEDCVAQLSNVGVAEAAKRDAMSSLREVVETAGEHDRILTDCFMSYASQPFQDDVFLSKPNAACEWLHFHDQLSSRVNVSHDWELHPYLSHPILGFHNLFASPAKRSWQDRDKQHEDEQQGSFTGLRAHQAALETIKSNSAALTALHSTLSCALSRSFRSSESLMVELLPSLMSMLTPDVKPVVVGGSGETAGIVSVRKERDRHLIDRAARVMHEIGLVFERTRVEAGQTGQSSYIYRMEPCVISLRCSDRMTNNIGSPIDDLTRFETNETTGRQIMPARYAVRQAMEQAYQKYAQQKNAEARRARSGFGMEPAVVGNTLTNAIDIHLPPSVASKRPSAITRDFFGRPVSTVNDSSGDKLGGTGAKRPVGNEADNVAGKGTVWLSFHEGFSNAVRKPMSLAELLKDF